MGETGIGLVWGWGGGSVMSVRRGNTVSCLPTVVKTGCSQDERGSRAGRQRRGSCPSTEMAAL